MSGALSPLAAALLFLVGAPLGASGRLDEYLPSQFEFRLLTEQSGTEGRESMGGFPVAVLDDYILLSYSRWRVAAPAGEALTLEAYEMHDAAGAYGLFSLWMGQGDRREKVLLDLPVEHFMRAGQLLFWRGNYAFKLRVGGEELLPAAERLVAALSDAIPQLNLYPLTVVYLPQEGLIRESIRFYLGSASFQLERDFPDELRSVIGLEKDVEITSALYTPQGYNLVMLGYPTTALAREQLVRMQTSLESYFSEQGVYMKRAGVLVAIFFGPETEAVRILEQVRYLPTVKWIQDKSLDAILREQREDALSFLGVLKRSALFTLAFVVFTLAGGIAGGLIRYRTLQRFPSLIEKDMPIHLPLD